jgi:hypothetical protein
MSETLLDIVQQACNEVLIPAPSSVINSTDEFAMGMLAMAQASGRDLVRRFEWGALVTLATIPTVAGQGDYTLPTDYYRMVDDTAWDQSTHWFVGGPLSPAADRYLRDSVIGASTVYRSFRMLGRKIRITPTPPDASGIIAFEYLSKSWITTAAGVAATNFTADTDTTVFDFDLMVKACKWRWMSAKGQDAAEMRQEYEDALAALKGADQGGGTLNMGGWYDDDMGGQVYAATSPNFRLSDGSGNTIIID